MKPGNNWLKARRIRDSGYSNTLTVICQLLNSLETCCLSHSVAWKCTNCSVTRDSYWSTFMKYLIAKSMHSQLTMIHPPRMVIDYVNSLQTSTQTTQIWALEPFHLLMTSLLPRLNKSNYILSELERPSLTMTRIISLAGNADSKNSKLKSRSVSMNYTRAIPMPKQSHLYQYYLKCQKSFHPQWATPGNSLRM